MTNLEKYNQIFVEVFGVSANVLNDNFSKASVADWDSVHQLNIISLMEDAFDIMIDPDDIMSCTSYEAGKDILMKNGIGL